MAWVSVHEQLRDHHKLRDFAKRLNCSRHEALGVLVALWLWGINNADRNGLLKSAGAEDIADGIMYRGQSADSLLDSLVDSGWIDRDGDNLYLHDWDIWQEQWFKALDKRAADTKRKRAERGQKGKTDAVSDNPADSPSDSHAESRRDVRASPSPNRHQTVNVPSSTTSTSENREGDGSRSQDDEQDMDAEEKSLVKFIANDFLPGCGMTQVNYLTAWVREGMTPAVVRWAMEQALKAGVRRIDYVEAILRDLHSQGITTAEAAIKAKELFQQKRGQPATQAGQGSVKTREYLDALEQVERTPPEQARGKLASMKEILAGGMGLPVKLDPG